ncbi:RISC-loading complex subunit tarbp2-like isoform X3 [Xenopus laevis]|uniref:RISC-loading complex subunit tarbp2-like isoform X3 n=1 Tax=Xenopus laevis TaxID=8355 RepID=A0A8J1MFU4_XENLA|nr:RISC-loading complex subunit tarbp2-like isoform X3 [Xenopus laevis]
MSENGECGNQTPSGFPSIEQMLASSPGKTPISLLQEYGTRVGKTPVYDLLKAEGQAHQPNFTFRVSVGDINCTGQFSAPPSTRGQGPSKKAAKHKAAEEALSLLKEGDMFGIMCEENSVMLSVEQPAELKEVADMSPPPSTRNHTIEMKPPLSAQQSECNPVGALQELVVQKGWRLPEYTVTQESGPAHRKEFTMTCRVERFLEIGWCSLWYGGHIQAVAHPRSWQSGMQLQRCFFRFTGYLQSIGSLGRQNLRRISFLWGSWMEVGAEGQLALGTPCEIPLER